MTQRDPEERQRDSAALQEAAAGVVHGVYRAVKACLFHTDVNNDAVTGLTAAAATTVAEYCQLASCAAVSIAFLGDAVFVNRQILKGSRDTHALASALGELLEPCGVTELTLRRDVTTSAVAQLAKLLADVQRDRAFAPRVTAGEIDGISAGKAKFAATGAARAESPGSRAARTYAISVVTVQSVFAEVEQKKFELPRRIKRVAQKIVALADEDSRLLVALAASGASIEPAAIAVASAILTVAMTKQLTTDRVLLTSAAMTALLHDAGRIAATPPGETRRKPTDDELDRVPGKSVLALTAMGRMHAPARARTALLYEVWAQRRAHRLGALYGGRRPPTVLSRIIGLARAFAELRAAGAGGGLGIDDAIQMLTSRATDGTEKALVKLFIGALGIYPAGTMVELNTGELGVVMATPALPVHYVRPPVKILYDAHANLLETPVDVDLAAPSGEVRFIWRNIDADERQMKAMRSYVIAAQAAKRRGEIDAVAVTAPPPAVIATVPGVDPAGPTHRPPRPSPSITLAAQPRKPRVQVLARNDSSPPSSMQDEVFSRRSIKNAPPVSKPIPRSEAETIRPVPTPPSPEIAITMPPQVPDPSAVTTAPPPPEADPEPSSKHDDLLAAFLTGGPLGDSEPPKK
ncbi:MAG: hypothetical protein KF819_13580 [Labilithrix sp.]|nr:hypothetical protein [Labilithrix sp.]